MAGDSTPIDPQSLEKQLSSLLLRLREIDSEQSWQDVERVAHSLANSLRVREGPGKMTRNVLTETG
jgi:hypothetical protein